MSILELVIVIVICAVASFLIYGMWKWEHDRYNFKQKHGIDPKYHGWDLDKDKE